MKVVSRSKFVSRNYFQTLIPQNLSPLLIESTLICKIQFESLVIVEKIAKGAPDEKFESDSFKRIIDKELAKYLSQPNSPSPSPRSDNNFNSYVMSHVLKSSPNE